MSRLLVSKNGRAPKFLTFSGLLFIALGIWLFTTADNGFYMEDYEEFIAYAGPAFMCIAGVLFEVFANSYSKTSIAIYDDHIEGVGTCGKGKAGRQNFYFDGKTNYTVTKERSLISVNANGASYFISLTAEEADEVYRIATKKPTSHESYRTPESRPMRESRPASENPPISNSAEPVICSCPVCGAKCRVPAGKGRIMIKCPKCGNSFTANT